MKVLFTIFLLNLSANIFANYFFEPREEEFDERFMECKDSIENDPPFYISKTYQQGEKLWENLRDENGKKVATVLKGTPLAISPALYRNAVENGESVVPAKVLGMNALKGFEALSESKRADLKSSVKAGLDNKAPAGLEGFINVKSVEPVSNNFKFIVTNDTVLKKIHDSDVPENKIIEFAQIPDGRYLTKQCCDVISKICFTDYLFNLTDISGQTISSFSGSDAGACFSYALSPIHQDSVEDMFSYLLGDDSLSLETLTTALIKTEKPNKRSGPLEEMVKFHVDANGNGPGNSKHYTKDDNIRSDLWVKTYTGCAFQKVILEFDKTCKTPGCKVYFGNMFHKPSYGVHGSHGSGECIDIRPFRKSSIDHGLTYKDEVYDREKTQKFVNLLGRAGASVVLFNDIKVEGVAKVPGHDNHLHFCFPKPKDEEKNVCKNGLPEEVE